MKKKREKVKIITFSGPSAVGKDTMIELLRRFLGIQLVVSHTTRKMRSGENNGREYFFTTDEVFDAMRANGEFIEIREFEEVQTDGSIKVLKYGLTREEVESKSGSKPCSMAVDMNGLFEIKEELGEESIYSFYLDAPDEALILRAMLRDNNFDQVKFEQRLEDDREIFKNLDEFDELLENIDLHACFESIKMVVEHIKNDCEM